MVVVVTMLVLPVAESGEAGLHSTLAGPRPVFVLGLSSLGVANRNTGL